MLWTYFIVDFGAAKATAIFGLVFEEGWVRVLKVGGSGRVALPPFLIKMT